MFGNKSLEMGNCKFEASEGYLNMARGVRAQLENLKHMLMSHKYCGQKYLNKKMEFTSKQQKMFSV